MRVLFVTSEYAPLFKLGGLADVSAALPQALAGLGMTVDIVLPYYEAIKMPKVTCLGSIAVPSTGTTELVFVFGFSPHERVRVLLLRHPHLNDYHARDMVRTFAFFSQTVACLVRNVRMLADAPYDVIHCNDWHTALVPLLLGEESKAGKEKAWDEARSIHTILTIHNPLYQGMVAPSALATLGIRRTDFIRIGKGKRTRVNLLAEGLARADMMSTVSPTFARELAREKRWGAVSRVFRKRPDKVVGILNGIDRDMWDPGTDQSLTVRYDAKGAIAAKAQNKAALVTELGLTGGAVPLVAFIGRLEVNQKGVGILLTSLRRLLPSNSFEMVMLGTGKKDVVDGIATLARAHSSMFAFLPRFDDRLARKIYAGADIMVVPSKFEPCGLIQMIAMRYGTIPVVRKTGGLADTVIEGETGFTFGSYSSSALTQTLTRAILMWQKNRRKWHALVTRVMRQDFSWKTSARSYVTLYKHLTGNRPSYK